MNVEKEKKFYNQIPEMRMKLVRLQRLISICDPRLVDETSSINMFLKDNEQFKTTSMYNIMEKGFNIIKTDIINHCICPRRWSNNR